MHSSGTAHDVLLPIERVCEILSRSKASIYRDIKNETFPRAQKLSRWRLSLVMQIVEGTYLPECSNKLNSADEPSIPVTEDASETTVFTECAVVPREVQ